MNILRLIITFFVVSVIGNTYAEPESKTEFPFEVHLLFDGGSFTIMDKSSKDRTSTVRVIDKRIDSKTTGSMYLGYPGTKGARLMPKDEALKFIANAEAELLKYWGKDEFERLTKVASSPIPDDKNLQTILPSMHHYDTCVCIEVFARYRKQHNAEQVGSGQPATRSELEPEGNDKPQPEAEGRSR